MSDLLHRDLVEAIKYWTEDPDRCDMEGREDEVAASLRPVVVAELRRMADAAEKQLREAQAELDRATAGGPRYPELYTRSGACAFLRDELLCRADEIAGGGR